MLQWRHTVNSEQLMQQLDGADIAMQHPAMQLISVEPQAALARLDLSRCPVIRLDTLVNETMGGLMSPACRGVLRAPIGRATAALLCSGAGCCPTVV
jgi:hypothetical protein